MRQVRRQKGFILLLVVVMIPLLGMAAVVLTSNSRQIITQTRRHAVAVHAQLACESGLAWLEHNSTAALAENQPTILKIRHDNKTITCQIERISQSSDRATFNITGRAEDRRFSNEYSQQYTLKY